MKRKKTEKANVELDERFADNSGSQEFVEINMTDEEMDKEIQHHPLISKRLSIDAETRKKQMRRQELLLKKIFKAARKVLTDQQFQIFIMRYVYRMGEVEIAEQTNNDQPYIPLVLQQSVEKIQKELRIDIDLSGLNAELEEERNGEPSEGTEQSE